MIPRLRTATAVFLIVLPIIFGAGEPMATTTPQEWVQREWTQPNIHLYNLHGDFYELWGMRRDHNHLLMRGPKWNDTIITIADFTNVKAMYYDHTNNRYVMIGKNASDHLAAAYYSAAWSASAVTELTAATSNAGGVKGFRAVLFYGNSYIVGADLKVYKGTSYDQAHSEFYATADAWMLVRSGAELFMITNAGKVYKLNDAQDAFAIYLTPEEYIIPFAAYPFRGYIALLAQLQTGEIAIYRISQPTASEFYQIAQFNTPASTYAYSTAISALHNGRIYFSPGTRTLPDASSSIDIHVFDGSSIKLVAEIPDAVPGSAAQGLLQWERELIYWSIFNQTLTFQQLIGNAFTELAPQTDDYATGFTALTGSLAGQLIYTSKNSSGVHGIYHAGPDEFKDGCYVTSSWLDMGHPGWLKRLERLTVILDTAATDFKVLIKYRVNDASSWTTATTGNNTRRVSIGALGTEFYNLQIRIEYDDDTVAGDQDVRIAAVSATYTMGY